MGSGFHGFASMFPALCGPSLCGDDVPKWALTSPVNRAVAVSGSLECNMEPMPHYVMLGVFLGSRAVPHTVESLARFRITHCLVDGGFGKAHASPFSHPEDSLAPKRIASMIYQDVPLSDEATPDDIDMRPLWELGADFIDSALASGGVVLVHVRGRSRSASFVLVWLMRRLSIPAVAAARMLREICPEIDWRLVCLEQIPAVQAEG